MTTRPNRGMPSTASILWRSFELPGHEACRLFSRDSRWHLEGSAVFTHQQQPCRLDYQIVTNAAWQTLSASIAGWLGKSPVSIQIRTDHTHHWWRNEVQQPGVMGCIDLDLNFSPSTNLLPIRRFNLAVGEVRDITAAWLRFPGFTLQPLPQVYRRLDENTYRYESAGGHFVTELKVNRAGFVLDYPGLWLAEAASE